MAVLERFVPAVRWLRTYRRGDLKGDVSAGLIVAVMLVPQGMAYAMLAGLPPVVGLYASTLPLIVYAFLGSSRHLAVGPVAMVSLLVSVACSKLVPPGTEQYIALVLTLTLMIGALQLLMGILRLGFLVNFVSHAVISGFTSASAIIICLSQMKHLLGVKLAPGHSTVQIVRELAQRLGDVHPITAGIGLSSIALLAFLKKRFPRVPAAIVVMVGGALLVYLFGLGKMGVQTVGAVPRGLPSFSVPGVPWRSIGALFPTALTILFVGYMESIAVANVIATRAKYRVEPDQELRALGLANVFAALFSGYPVTGGFSRTAVNYQAGARTGLSSLITAVLVILTLLVLTPIFYHLPNAVLAGIIIVAVSGLIDLEDVRYFFKVRQANGWTLVITFLSTLVLGVEQGILIGVAISLLLFIGRSSYPHIAELGYLEQEDVFRNVQRFPEAKIYRHVLILRVDAPLYFANMRFLEDHLRRRIEEKPDVEWVVLDLSDVNDMDAVAIHTMDEIMQAYRERNVHFALTAMIGPVRDLVARAGWGEEYGERISYLTVHHALRSIGVMEDRID